jgi:hypothetical protein
VKRSVLRVKESKKTVARSAWARKRNENPQELD